MYMEIHSPLELEILGALHALLYDDQNKRIETTVLGGTLYSYYKKMRRMEYINEAIASLTAKGVIKADLSKTAGNIEELKYGSISPTQAGEKLVLATIEPYWVYVPSWKTKYPNMLRNLLPGLSDPEDWVIFKKLFENVSWRNDYRIDEDKARSIIDEGKTREELPYFGKFRDKLWGSTARVAELGQRQTKSGKYPQVIRMLSRFKPLGIESFEAFKTAKEYYKYFSEMFGQTSYQYFSIHAFLKNLKKFIGILPRKKKLNEFFDHLISVGLLQISVHQATPDLRWRVQVCLSSGVDRENWEKWELGYITENFNPQYALYYQLSNGNPVRLNPKTQELEADEQEVLTSALDNVVVLGDEMARYSTPKQKAKTTPSEVNKTVFVVFGRNEKLKNSMFQFLDSIGLKPLEWNEAIKATGKPSPYIGEVLSKAFELARAIVVMFTPDDEVRLKEEFHLSNEPEYERQLTAQSRPNVIFEAGMALGRAEDRTVMVEIGDMRPFTDVLGRHVVRMNNTLVRREELISKLETAGCPVDKTGKAWLEAGDFQLEMSEKKIIEKVEAPKGSKKANIVHALVNRGFGNYALRLTNTGGSEARNVRTSLDDTPIEEHQAYLQGKEDKRSIIIGAGASFSYLLVFDKACSPPFDLKVQWTDNYQELHSYRTTLSY
jgi:predicted nucleotide-binding protein